MLEFCGIEIKEGDVDALVEIKRFEHDSDRANRGIVFLNGDFFGFSLECPNLDNLPFYSRVNAGEYTARKVHSEKRGYFWLLDNANDRTEIILFHMGNTVASFNGCIGLGAEIGKINEQRAIFETKLMCKQFMKETKAFSTLNVIITIN